MKREQLKNYAEMLGFKMRWYHPNWYVKKKLLKILKRTL